MHGNWQSELARWPLNHAIAVQRSLTVTLDLYTGTKMLTAEKRIQDIPRSLKIPQVSHSGMDACHKCT